MFDTFRDWLSVLPRSAGAMADARITTPPFLCACVCACVRACVRVYVCVCALA